MVNLHFSLLPRWRGAAPVERALLAGDEVTGVCVMALEEGLDTGGVYARREVPIGPETTAAELRTELVAVGTDLLVETLGAPSGTWLDHPSPQEGEVTYAAKLTTADYEIDWDRPVEEIHRLIRVGGAWTMFRGKRLKVRRGAARRRTAAARDRATRREGAHVVRLVAQRRPPRRRRTVRHAVTAPITSPIPAPTDRSARRVALDALRRIEDGGAYANLVLGPMLATSGLSDMDRRFVTELVYGTTRMRRACDSHRRPLRHVAARRCHAVGAPARRLPARVRRCASTRGRRRDGRSRSEADTWVRQCRAAQGLPAVDGGPAVAVGRCPPELPRLDRRPVPGRTR